MKILIVSSSQCGHKRCPTEGLSHKNSRKNIFPLLANLHLIILTDQCFVCFTFSWGPPDSSGPRIGGFEPGDVISNNWQIHIPILMSTTVIGHQIQT